MTTTETKIETVADLTQAMIAHIAIEQMMFGDYRVQVWDVNCNSLLEREYFCRTYASAHITALAVQIDLFPDFPIYHYENNLVRKLQ